MNRYAVRYNKVSRRYEVVDRKQNRVVEVFHTSYRALDCCDSLNAQPFGTL